jgi:hypothetical protein
MPKIEITMYEVQLGAAILLQFYEDNRTVRVLADAGIHAKNYSRDHVQKKLKATSIDQIDLLMGTHYDKDHLDGLIDVVACGSIGITEAWLPPVSDDSETETSKNDTLGSESMCLGQKFASRGGDIAFKDYVDYQKNICEKSLQARNEIIEEFGFRQFTQNEDKIFVSSNLKSNADHQAIEDYFNAHLKLANSELEVPEGRERQADEDVDEPNESMFDEVRDSEEFVRSCSVNFRKIFLERIPWKSILLERIPWEDKYLEGKTGAEIRLERLLSDRPLYHDELLKCLAVVRKSAARNAINANSLKQLINALNAKKIPIRFEHILHGEPKYYVINSNGEFRESKKEDYDVTQSPKFTLLGPSDFLIEKHKKILPKYALSALMFELILIRSITPSNQLSYVVKFEYANQNILVSGDTGFVDFKCLGKNRKSYFQAILKSLHQLDVVQIAHHAGNNAHFYRVLLKSI